MRLQGKIWLRLFHTVRHAPGTKNTQTFSPPSGLVRCLHHGAPSSLPLTPTASSSSSPSPPPPSSSSPYFLQSSMGHELRSAAVSEDKVDGMLDVCYGLQGLQVRGGIGLTVPDSGNGQCANFASWSSTRLEYICPSEKLSKLPELAILEEVPNGVTYDLPKCPAGSATIIINPTAISAEIAEPTNPARNAPKEARRILKIRRKKMKRHLLKKFRKRMAFTLRKMKRARKKKKELVFQARLAGIREWGESFDAKQWLQDELGKARKGGFYINVLEKKQ